MEVKMGKKINRRVQLGIRNFRNFNLRYRNIYKDRYNNFNDSMGIRKSKVQKIRSC